MLIYRSLPGAEPLTARFNRIDARTMTLKDYLASRRSVPAAQLVAPAPPAGELEAMLSIAARVPDHGKLAPWRFIIIGDENRAAFVDRLMEIWQRANPDASEEALAVERGKRTGAPLLVVVVSCAAPHPKIPEWEQELSAGAVCMNLIHAAHGHGYGAQWLTGWPAYDKTVGELLGLQTGERIAGFIHIGTPAEAPTERARPDLAAITTRFAVT